MGIRRFASVRERPVRAKMSPRAIPSTAASTSTIGCGSPDTRNCSGVKVTVNQDTVTNQNELDADRNRQQLRDEIERLRANEAALRRRCDGAAASAEEWRGFAIYTQRLLQQELDAYGRRLAAALRENAALREKCESQASECGDVYRNNSPKCQCHSDASSSLPYGDPPTSTRTLRSKAALSARSYDDGGTVDENPSNSQAVDEIVAHNSRVLNYIDSLAQRIARLDVNNGTVDPPQQQSYHNNNNNNNYVEYNNDNNNNNNKTISGIRLPSLRLLNNTRPLFDAWRGAPPPPPSADGGQRASSASTDSAFSTASTALLDERDDASLVEEDEDDLPPEMPRLICTELKSASAVSRLSAPPSPRNTVSGMAPAALTLPRSRQPPGDPTPAVQRLRIRMRPTNAPLPDGDGSSSDGQQCSPV